MLSTARPPIFIVDNNADDQELFQAAFEQVCSKNQVKFFYSGQALLDQLSDTSQKLPSLVLMNLQLPDLDGLTTLGHMKRIPRLVRIPTIILGDSDAASDCLLSYQTGANSYIGKPRNLDEFKHFVDVMCRYWLEIAQRPTDLRFVH